MDREQILAEETVETTDKSAVCAVCEPLKIEEKPGETEQTDPRKNTPCSECREYLAEMTSHVSGNNRPLTPAGWIWVNLAMLVPPLNVLLLFLWACGGTERTNLKNYARGVLLTVVLLVLVFLVSVVILDACGYKLVYPEWVERIFS